MRTLVNQVLLTTLLQFCYKLDTINILIKSKTILEKYANSSGSDGPLDIMEK